MTFIGYAFNIIVANLIYIIPLGVFAWFLWWYYKRTRRLRTCLLIQDDRTIVEKKLPVATRYMGNRKVGEPAWLVVHKLLRPFKNKLVAVITERDAFPADPFNELTEKDIKDLGDVKAIAREHYHTDRLKIATQETNRMVMWMIFIMIAVVAILLFLILGVPFMQQQFSTTFGG